MPDGTLPAGRRKRTPEEVRRRFDYDRARLPSAYLAEQESGVADLDSAIARTGLTIGYPAWNLLYYCLRCAVDTATPVVVETGTNRGFSTIVLAQCLKDLGATTRVVTCDSDPAVVEVARRNIAAAGLSPWVDLRTGDSLEVLAGWVAAVERVDFAFLDGDHSAEHVVKEFGLLHEKVRRPGSTVYFDNTSAGGVALALERIVGRYGGNLVQFPNCSWSPPGNAIWQPARRP